MWPILTARTAEDRQTDITGLYTLTHSLVGTHPMTFEVFG